MTETITNISNYEIKIPHDHLTKSGIKNYVHNSINEIYLNKDTYEYGFVYKIDDIKIEKLLSISKVCSDNIGLVNFNIYSKKIMIGEIYDAKIMNIRTEEPSYMECILDNSISIIIPKYDKSKKYKIGDIIQVNIIHISKDDKKFRRNYGKII